MEREIRGRGVDEEAVKLLRRSANLVRYLALDGLEWWKIRNVSSYLADETQRIRIHAGWLPEAPAPAGGAFGGRPQEPPRSAEV